MVEQRTDLRAEARAIAALAPDVVEWRADCLAGLEAEHVQSVLAALRHELRCALIVTCRLADEGGVGAWADADRLAILEAALEPGRTPWTLSRLRPGGSECWPAAQRWGGR
jgi:3-dehydroquinate dehydratase